MTKKVYKIADFIIDTQTRRFFHKNQPVDMSSRAFDILSYLIQKRGEIVEKDELLQVVWTDSFVEENNLAVHISALRRVLKERRGESQFIKTISGRGYSFIAPIEEINQNEKDFKEISSLKFSETSGENKESIAVLPFTFDEFNLDIEYLANGLTQSLIADLSQISNIKVMAYSAVKKYKNTSFDLQEIGFLLGVQKVITGHISNYKDNFEISVELVDTMDKSHLWGRQYAFDFSDILQIKKNILLAIAEKLKLQFPGFDNRELKKEETINTDSFKLYLKGRYILETVSTRGDLKKDLNQSLRFFKEAVKKDPNNTFAYIGTGETYIEMFHNNIQNKYVSYEETKKVLQSALNLNSQLSEVHILKGMVNIIFERDLLEAERSLTYAIELNKNNPEALQWLSYVCICFSNFYLALSLQKKAVQLDPTSIHYNGGLLRVFYFSEDYNKAVTQAEEIIELDHRSVSAHFFLAIIYAHLGLFDEALVYIEAAIQLRPSPDMTFAKAYIYALMKDRKQAEKIISKIFAETPEEIIDYTYLATVYSALNDKDKAFSALDHAYEKGGAELTLLKVNPRFKNLRGDERFTALLQRLNLI